MGAMSLMVMPGKCRAYVPEFKPIFHNGTVRQLSDALTVDFLPWRGISTQRGRLLPFTFRNFGIRHYCITTAHIQVYPHNVACS